MAAALFWGGLSTQLPAGHTPASLYGYATWACLLLAFCCPGPLGHIGLFAPPRRSRRLPPGTCLRLLGFSVLNSFFSLFFFSCGMLAWLWGHVVVVDCLFACFCVYLLLCLSWSARQKRSKETTTTTTTTTTTKRKTPKRIRRTKRRRTKKSDKLSVWCRLDWGVQKCVRFYIKKKSAVCISKIAFCAFQSLRI